MLGVMSGQGGVAVGISLVQTYIAVMGTLGQDDTTGTKSLSSPQEDQGATTGELGAGVGLWLLATIPIFFCIYLTRPLLSAELEAERKQFAHRGRRLFKPDSRDEFDTSQSQVDVDSDIDGREMRFRAEEDDEFGTGGKGSLGRLKDMVRRNKGVYFSVAWVFVVTLVRTY